MHEDGPEAEVVRAETVQEVVSDTLASILDSHSILDLWEDCGTIEGPPVGSGLIAQAIALRATARVLRTRLQEIRGRVGTL